MESVILSPYIITCPLAFLAQRPTVCIKLLVLRKNPSLSASNIAISDTSGISIPSRNKLIPTTTSYFPTRKS